MSKTKVPCSDKAHPLLPATGIDGHFDDDTYVPIGTLTTDFNEREFSKASQTHGILQSRGNSHPRGPQR
ncbi:hypothetical protein PISMIDRAFT_674598 [Pisolithus microcarpus 441]|uniref:Unplaced genomic scaffold scaffold_11, whole genome shotgun sequence n=1 Tax=Pisolithus microcarpus 441 TaxID=765257 RepID=A0A0C9ZZL5_9AGAM|nr:hypothetical protein PISMIDRAFT_674598 [Pisolithus microcarpus 441]